MNFKVLVLGLAACLITVCAQAETYFWNATKEQRAGFKADLLVQAQEIESQMLSEKQERLLGYAEKGVFWLGMGALCAGIAVHVYWYAMLHSKYLNYKTEKPLFDRFMFKYKVFSASPAFENMSEFDVKNHVTLIKSWMEKLNTSARELNNVSYISDIFENSSLVATISSLVFCAKNYQQSNLKAKLEDIKKKIAELDALDAAEAQNVVVA